MNMAFTNHITSIGGLYFYDLFGVFDLILILINLLNCSPLSGLFDLLTSLRL